MTRCEKRSERGAYENRGPLRATRRPSSPPEDPYSTLQIGKALFAMACELSLDPRIHGLAPSVKRKTNGGA